MRRNVGSFLGLAISLALLTVAASDHAAANSRLSVQNDGPDKVLVNIFNGDDSICLAEAKHKTVGPGETEGMGCEGGGKHRCKVMVSVSHEEVCLDLYNGCGDTTIIVPNGATRMINDPPNSCSI